MTQKEAEALILRVQQEAPPGKIQSTIEHVRQSEQQGYQVKLLLRSMQRVQTAYKPDDWLSIKQAWHFYLYGKEAEDAQRSRRGKDDIKYLVNGVPMLIIQCKDGYWRGSARQGGIDIKKYFGKNDPRGQLIEVS